MAVACRTCGNQNPDGVSFCQYCGSSLQAPPGGGGGQRVGAARPAVYAPPSGPGGGAAQPQGHDGAQYGQRYVQRHYGAVVAPPKDPATGILLESLPGIFVGFLGIGWLWAGETTIGIALLLGFWAIVAVEVVAIIFTLGLAAICISPLVHLGLPLLSGYLLQKRLRERQALAAGGPRY